MGAVTPELVLYGLDPLEADAVCRVMRAIGLPPATAAAVGDELPDPDPDRVIVSTPPNGEPWDPGPLITAHRSGHRVVLLGHPEPVTLTVLRAAGIECVKRNQVAELARIALGDAADPPATATGPAPRTPRLTPRERMICQLLVDHPGITREGLAEELGVSQATAKVHLGNVRKNLGAIGMSQAALVQHILALRVLN